jgi:hypothetical protein
MARCSAPQARAERLIGDQPDVSKAGEFHLERSLLWKAVARDAFRPKRERRYVRIGEQGAGRDDYRALWT